MKSNKNMKIFLVDNDLFCLNLYEQSIKNLGYKNVSIFLNGADCLEGLAQKPNIVFLDSGSDNINVAEILKQIKLFDPNIYVVMVTDAEDQHKTSALKNGIFDYIIKGEDELVKAESVLLKISRIQNLYAGMHLN